MITTTHKEFAMPSFIRRHPAALAAAFTAIAVLNVLFWSWD